MFHKGASKMKDITRPIVAANFAGNVANLGKYFTHGRENNNSHPLLNVVEPVARKRSVLGWF